MEGPYSDKVMEHFRNPHNVGEIPDADGVGNVGNGGYSANQKPAAPQQTSFGNSPNYSYTRTSS